MILVTGGARSGKSEFAENIATEKGDKVLYIATSIPFDDEMKSRVELHKNRRPSNWDTFEGFKDIDKFIYANKGKYDCILFDCITIFVTNLIFEYAKNPDNMSREDFNITQDKIIHDMENILLAIEKINTEIVFVTNEVGMGIVPENKLSRQFRDIAGKVNQLVAKKSDEVYLTVCGIPMKIK